MTTVDCRAARRPLGFTFVEVLAAMLFMAIVIPATVQSILAINRMSVTAQRKRQAAELADRVLNQALVEDTYKNGDVNGKFSGDESAYRYELRKEDWSEDASLSMVSVKVYYSVQNQEYYEQLSTLVDPNDSSDSSSTSSSSSSTSGS